MNGVVDKWFDGLLRQLVRPEHILIPITVKIHKERSQVTMEMQDLLNGRCGWCGTDSLYVKYHDEEWGRLVTDDRLLFEFLTLESAQAGLRLDHHIAVKEKGIEKHFMTLMSIKSPR